MTKHKIALPDFILPRDMKNDNNYIISLGNLCMDAEYRKSWRRYFSRLYRKRIIYDENEKVIGILSGEKELLRMVRNQIYMNPKLP